MKVHQKDQAKFDTHRVTIHQNGNTPLDPAPTVGRCICGANLRADSRFELTESIERHYSKYKEENAVLRFLNQT